MIDLFSLLMLLIRVRNNLEGFIACILYVNTYLLLFEQKIVRKICQYTKTKGHNIF